MKNWLIEGPGLRDYQVYRNSHRIRRKLEKLGLAVNDFGLYLASKLAVVKDDRYYTSRLRYIKKLAGKEIPFGELSLFNTHWLLLKAESSSPFSGYILLPVLLWQDSGKRLWYQLLTDSNCDHGTDRFILSDLLHPIRAGSWENKPEFMQELQYGDGTTWKGIKVEYTTKRKEAEIIRGFYCGNPDKDDYGFVLFADPDDPTGVHWKTRLWERKANKYNKGKVARVKKVPNVKN